MWPFRLFRTAQGDGTTSPTLVVHKCLLAPNSENGQEREAARVSVHSALRHKSPKKGITTMKKLLLALVIAALLDVPSSKAAYIGTFAAGSFYSFEIAANNSVETAVTFMSVVRGRLQVDNVITANGNLPPTNIPVPARAERVVLLVETRGGSALIRVNGGVPQEFVANPEIRLVADVVP